MSQKKEKVVGIIGGMGPEATIDLMQRIIRLTPAIDDIDHIRCIVDNNPKIPSRIAAIIEGTRENPGEDPAPCLADMARRLEIWGADFLAIACNTAHYYYEDIKKAVNIPVVHIIDTVQDHIKKEFSSFNKIGILASPAIRITKIYEEKFNAAGITVIYPDPDFQDLLFTVIRQVKAGNHNADLCKNYTRVCNHLNNKGCHPAIVACTELSALDVTSYMQLVDAAQVLAKKIIDIAKGKKQI